ncbi:MAG: bile acid:sodium symporter family protein [Bacteroidales bacterium]|nr:bile acid:sodium symporter family protein [Bacteroidales bacterium]
MQTIPTTNLPTRVSRLLSSHTSAFIIGVAALSFALPQLFSWVSGLTQTAILGIIMLSMGMTLTTADFRNLAATPANILVGTMAQYTIMPLIAWTLTRLIGLDTSLAIGIILVGCCPGGVSSNIMSFLCKGDVAFSVGMTTASTLLSPLITPMLVLWLAGQNVEVDAAGMFVNILMVTLLPVTLGFALNTLLGRKEGFGTVRDTMPGVSVVGLACIVGGVISGVHDRLIEHGPALFGLTFAVVLCHNTLGYLLGYAAGRLFKMGAARKRTLSIEVGMQNAGLATNLAANFFMAANPLSVVPCAISCVWHSISGTLLAQLFVWADNRRKG